MHEESLTTGQLGLDQHCRVVTYPLYTVSNDIVEVHSL